MAEVIEVNGMRFEKVRLCPNFKGEYSSYPCPECHLDISWVDYGEDYPCRKVDDCAWRNRKDPHVWCIVGGMENLKLKAL